MHGLPSTPVVPSKSISSSRSWVLPGAEAAFEGGRRALRAGFFEPARAIFGALLPHETGRDEVAISLARTELAGGNALFAEALLEAMDEKLLRQPHLQALMAECAFQRGKTANGLRRVFACSELFPRHPQVRYLQARLAWIGGAEAEAEVQFLALAADPEVGDRSRAWAVFCGWRQGQLTQVSDLLSSLRTDDVVCEGLREFGQNMLEIPWTASDRVDPHSRGRIAAVWRKLHLRQTRGANLSGDELLF